LKIILLANTDWYLYNFRLPLARALRQRGYEVVMVSPPGGFGERLVSEGFRWIPFPFSRHGMNPLAEAATVLRITHLYRRERPDLTHHFTIKCVLYGGLAARLARVRGIVSSITGLGHLFTTPGPRATVLAPLVRALYRRVLSRSQVIFQNPDDRAYFENSGALDGAPGVHLIRGSGVDTARFRPAARPPAEPPVTVVLVARLLREKGIEEFVHAARVLRSRGVDARFVVAGDPDPGNPSSHDAYDLARWRADSPVEFLGHHEDMVGLLQSAHVCCLPSWREGTPRSLLEAGACALPLVATDVPGCREVVRSGDNGILVPARSPEALAGALESLIADRERRRRMGARAREIVDREFSEALVVSRTLDVYAAALA
jgi:glycosyltransferase involved in cell wall biosynthesis